MGSRQKIVGVIGAFLLLVATGGTAWAATYYVATNGSDSNNGSQAAPFKSVQKAVGVVRAGDTVIIKPGRYPGFHLRNINGAPGAPITFFGEPGAIIDSYLGGAYRPIEFYGGSYVTIDGLELTDSGPIVPRPACGEKDPRRGAKNGIKLNAADQVSLVYPHHLIFKNLEIHRMPSQAILGSATDSLLLHSHIYDNGAPSRHEEAYGTYLKGQRWVIRGNRIHDNNGHGIRTGNDPRQGSTTELLVDSIIENNLLYDNGRATFGHGGYGGSKCVEVAGGDGIVVWHGSGNIIRNNIVYGNRGYGIRVAQNFTVNNKPNLIYNNTVYNNGSSGGGHAGGVSYQGGEGIYCYAGNKTIVKNNISYLSGRQNISSNCSNQLSNNLTTDPKFVNPAAGDFGIQAGSPAIDKGIALAEVKTDFTGKARPEGAAYDIGAFEGVGSRADVLPGMGGGLPAGVGGGAPVLLGPNGEVCYSGYL